MPTSTEDEKKPETTPDPVAAKMPEADRKKLQESNPKRLKE